MKTIKPTDLNQDSTLGKQMQHFEQEYVSLCRFRQDPKLLIFAMSYLTSQGKHRVVLSLYVQPKSSRTKIAGLHDGSVKLAITAPPVDGKANTQITAFIAKLFKIPKSAVTLLRGLQSRHKKIAIAGISQVEIQRILAPFL